jgi:hypothetical protein
MPRSVHDDDDDDDECFIQAKSLRSSTTSKVLRHLRVNERISYKKTCTVKKM